MSRMYACSSLRPWRASDEDVLPALLDRGLVTDKPAFPARTAVLPLSRLEKVRPQSTRLIRSDLDTEGEQPYVAPKYPSLPLLGFHRLRDFDG